MSEKRAIAQAAGGSWVSVEFRRVAQIEAASQGTGG